MASGSQSPETASVRDFKWEGRTPWPSIFSQLGGLGRAELLFLGEFNHDRLAELIVFLSIQLVHREGASLLPSILVVAPPNLGVTQQSIRECAGRLLPKVSEVGLSRDAITSVCDRLAVVTPKSMEMSSILDVITSRNSAEKIVVVLQASSYCEQAIEIAPFDMKTKLAEDEWLPHLKLLGRRVAELARDEFFCLLDVGQLLPARPDALKDLSEIGEIGIAGYANTGVDTALLENADDWATKVRAGRAEEALKQIDQLGEIGPEERAVLKIQALQRGGDSHAAVEMLSDQQERFHLYPNLLKVRLAAIAAEGDEDALARVLLDGTALGLTSQRALEAGLKLSIQVSSDSNEWLTQLEALFPTSKVLFDFYASSLVELCASDLSRSTDWTCPKSDLASAGRDLLDGLKDEEAELIVLNRDLSTRWPVFGSVIELGIANFAASRKRAREAIYFASPLSLEGVLARHAAMIIISCTEEVLVGVNEQEVDFLVPSIVEIFAYLAKTPEDSRTRVELSRVLSVTTSGLAGTAILTLSLLSIIEGNSPIDVDATVAEPADSEVFSKFFEPAIKWLASRGQTYLGRVVLPEELISADADELISSLMHLVEHVGESGAAREDAEFLLQLASLASGLGSYAKARNRELSILRVIASKMAIGGQYQRGRDLAEHILTLANGDPRRSRMAWGAYADVFQRAQNHIDAILGLGCALTTGAALPFPEAFHELMTTFRVLRDMKLRAPARSVLERAKAVSVVHGISSAEHRLETSLIGMDLSVSDGDRTALEGMAARICCNLQGVLTTNDEALPALVLAAQIEQACLKQGILLGEDFKRAMEEAADRVGAEGNRLVQAISDAVPSASDVHSWAQDIEPARFAEDVPTDLRIVVRAAGRLLGGQEALGSPAVAAFAVELLSEHGVSTNEREMGGGESENWLPRSVGDVLQKAVDISRLPVSVSLVGVDDKERLVRVTAFDGIALPVVVEAEETFSTKYLEEWSKSFPYDYGTKRGEEPNTFYSSMSRLGLSAEVSKRMIIVADARIQHVPATLLMLNGDLLGRSSAVGVAPSVSWLVSSQKARVKCGASCAWIPLSESGEPEGALGMVAERLQQVLSEFDVKLRYGTQPPEDLAGAELAIVAAHGGLDRQKQFFQVVADEAQMKLSQVELARHLKNAGVVVLFVCSGGRVDPHPWTHTTVALPKELLSRGCQAVVASPWPLDARVPSHWLQAFLEAWNAGSLLLEANFHANRAVAAAMGDAPQHSLAMNVFGNPLVRRSALL